MKLAVLTVVLLGFATGACADCAWVLWVKDERADYLKKTQHESWEVLHALGTEGACRRELQSAIVRATSAVKPGVRYTVEENVIGLAFFRTDAAGQATGTPIGAQKFSYVCIPDTIDPRASKSK